MMAGKQVTLLAAVCLLFGAVARGDVNRNSGSAPTSDSTLTDVADSVAKPAVVTPPQRPVSITVDQLAALEALADNPKHSVSPDTRAAYSPEAAKTIKSLSGPAFYAGYGGTLLFLLIAAAPL
ncbi:MAG: hypothetical protein DHS20C16_13470 [Phycisphaerae bacterium]|nr:MAG: hypothetical protein DHS20C16_13470 [Phycisphaerae bacterium]